MPPTESIDKTANADEASPPSPDAAAHPLDSAFGPAAADDDSTLEAPPPPPDQRALQGSAILPQADFEKLQHEVEHTRVIFVRGAAAISITALLSVGGALLFHFLAVGGFFLALFLTVTAPGGTGNGDLGSQSAGSNGGSIIVGEGPQGPPQIATDVNVLLNHTAPPPLPATPALPELTSTSTDPRQLATADLQGPEPDLIGIPSGDNRIGNLRPFAPPRHVPQQPTPPKLPPNNTLVVTPPPRDAQPADKSNHIILASVGTKVQPPSSPRAGTNAGGDDDPFGNEMIIPGAKADVGSAGNGAGDGNGINRGASAANNPEPAILEWDMPNFSDAIGFNPPARSTKCRVLVLPNGHAGKIEIVQSCGQPALDQKWVDSLMKAKFRPAYRDGKPYAANKDVELKYGNQ